MHIPVLLNEVLELLNPKAGDKIVDATFGYGGHTEAILKSEPECYVTAIDRDPTVQPRVDEFKKIYKDRFSFIPGKFSDVINSLTEKHDKVLFDFGVSSMQLDDAERGFSFSKDAKLDMRMSCNGLSAYDVINNYDEEDLAEIIFKYGDERHSRKIANAIVNARRTNTIETTLNLHNIIVEALGFEKIHKVHSNIDVATKTFQAIRIFVNDELREIDKTLHALPIILSDNAIVATITFHALEDRIVKYWAVNTSNFTPLTRNVIKPSYTEVKNNPRARSAKLRGYVYKK